VPAEARFCPSCGGAASRAADVSQTPTVVSSSFPSSGSAPGRKSRFVAGEVVAARYRIEGLLGRGGMGEVYRAEDMKVGADVALKFLPASLQQNPAMLARFHSEVRLARQVSHPNVCRVHDIGEVDGQHFLSMEFVDGENLASLLRRIGRLPGDKAIEIGRQICAGLAAAHDRGVLHRDLKPENVMLDGQGRVRLMDFGLAAANASIAAEDMRSGTPAYMAPEQLEGREVTVRSDIYALGLVLHELFTGRQMFDAPTLADLRRQRSSFTPERASLTAADADPAVEQVIRRCLETDPEQRPASALAVALALPGGDPLREALAAGELPSPEMVRAAGTSQGLTIPAAWIALCVFVVGLLVSMYAMHTRSVVGSASVALAPDALAERAREVLRGASVTSPAIDRAWGFRADRSALDWLRDHGPEQDRYAPLATLRTGTTLFWYRQAPKALEAVNLRGAVSPNDPNPLTTSGSAVVYLDEAGRLLSFLSVPPQVPPQDGDGAAEPDWAPLFGAAGIDEAAATEATSEWIPSVFADARRAWTATWPEAKDIPLRIEAASFQGKPVWFEVVRPWSRAGRMEAAPERTSERWTANLNIALVLSALVGAMILARRSVKAGRADVRGAVRVSFAVYLVTLVSWACGAHHLANAQDEWGQFLEGNALALLLTGICGLLYLGLEPVVRKRLPHTLVGWNRLMAGWVKDPLVAREVLVGLAAAGALYLCRAGLDYAGTLISSTQMPPALVNFDGAAGLRSFIGVIATVSVGVLISPMLILLLLAVLTGVLRSATVAFVVTTILIGAVASGAAMSVFASPVLAILSGFLTIGGMLFVLRRFGLVALMAMTLPGLVLSAFPTTIDASRWYFGYSAAAAACLFLLAIAAARWSVPTGRAA